MSKLNSKLAGLLSRLQERLNRVDAKSRETAENVKTVNRRSFLKWLGVGSVAVVAAPTVVDAVVPSASDKPEWAKGWVENPRPRAVIEDYNEYSNVSQFFLDSPIDPVVSKAAEAYGKAHGQRIANLYNEVFRGR